MGKYRKHRKPETLLDNNCEQNLDENFCRIIDKIDEGGGGGGSLPAGGTTGQALVKKSNADGDANWQDVKQVPTGGLQGQALVKQYGTRYGWETIPVPPSTEFANNGDVLTVDKSEDSELAWKPAGGGGETTHYEALALNEYSSSIYISEFPHGKSIYNIDLNETYLNSGTIVSIVAPDYEGYNYYKDILINIVTPYGSGNIPIEIGSGDLDIVHLNGSPLTKLPKGEKLVQIHITVTRPTEEQIENSDFNGIMTVEHKIGDIVRANTY